jgi:hypothetical protein
MRREGCKDGGFGLLSLQVLVPRQFARIYNIVNMEWGVKENHVDVIALHNCGKFYSQNFKLLKQLKISRMFIYREIKRYEELWSVEDRAQSGHLKSWRAEASIKTVRERIRRNPPWEQKVKLHMISWRILNWTDCGGSRS